MTPIVDCKISSVPEKYDIVIVGAGPVGLLLSTCLARWGYKIKHIDNRPTPTLTGRADGIQPRSLDLLRNMGLKRKIMAHGPAKVYEVAFWDPASKGICRTGTWASCPKFIDTRYPFTTLLHQGLIERVFIEDLETKGTNIQRPWTIKGFVNDGMDSLYPVETQLEHIDTKQREIVRSKYLFSAEGARSSIRQQLGIQLQHKSAIEHVWGVMDGVVRTNFPDIKMKCTIHSDQGSIMIIPRENNMVRLYIQLESKLSEDKDWSPRRHANEEEVQASAKKILAPYWIEWDSVIWYSVYPIGQGIADRYTLDHRVFLGGDCCHTHSPKAGQGMNTAFLDAVNLAWKIHHVESSFASRVVLSTYESERKAVAENLLAFDSKYAALFSERKPSANEVNAASHQSGSNSGSNPITEPNEFVETFKQNCELTSGYGIAYNANTYNWTPSHPAQSALFLKRPAGTSLVPGRIFPPASVIRVIDANIVHLEQEIPLNGSFRIYLFAGNRQRTRRAVADFASNLLKIHSFFSTYLRSDITDVSPHEQHNPHSYLFTFCTIFNASRPTIEIAQDVPELLARYSSHIYSDSIWDQRVPKANAAAHVKMGFCEESGGVVVVRPDAYVGCIIQLVEGSGTVDALNEYFASFAGEKSPAVY